MDRADEMHEHIEQREAAEFLKAKGWGQTYCGGFIGKCRGCHHDIHDDLYAVSPKGGLYHIRCALKRLKWSERNFVL